MKRQRYKEIDWSEIVYYDETSKTGLRWKISPSFKCKQDSQAGSISSGVWSLRYKGGNYKCHVIIWSLFNTLSGGMVIDHEDRNSLNNRLGNLREISGEKNMRNRSKSTKNKTGKTGVYYAEEKEVVIKIPAYYSATWVRDGKSYEKRFKIGELSKEDAFRLACECRDHMIEQLNDEGFGYTETHGQ